MLIEMRGCSAETGFLGYFMKAGSGRRAGCAIHRAVGNSVIA
jgi:hypothetical protein